jgi:steroid 5-alpha reductase family enzyme
MTGQFLTITAVSAVVVAVVLGVTFLVGERLGRHNVVDVAWGLAFVAVAVAVAVVGTGDPARRWLLAGLIGVWGLRLAIHLAVRSRGQGEDPRYEALLARSQKSRIVAVITKIYLLQGALVWFISLPIQLSATLPNRVSWPSMPGSGAWLAVVGVAIWCVGLFFEAVGDAQLHAFKRDPAHRGVVMDRGLWRYTRHPNYFGDACVWWGTYFITLTAGPWVLATILSPIVMTTLLTRVSGKDLLERHLANRPGYAEYVARTSGFIPLPPRGR